MSIHLTHHLAAATDKAATELRDAYLSLPAEKRAWSPEPSSRSALDQLAECALLAGNTATVIAERAWPETMRFEEYLAQKAALVAEGEATALSLLSENTAKVIAAIQAVPEEALSLQVPTPWRPMAMTEVLAYCHWNDTYHTGQIYYIASLLDCLP
jgi:hypothetical protein